jgi:16S rRNA (guanine(966)-N(2))-methyltransferase RsmD
VRVIAGERKGLRLVAPRGRGIRPTTDRVKQVLFDVLRDEVVGERVLDLYAGSGALGIEALSRGAAEAIFVERDPKALAALRRNLASAKYQQHARVVADAVEVFLRKWPAEETVGVVFADPPYGEEAVRLLGYLDRFRGLRRGGVAVIEHSSRQQLETALKFLRRWDRRVLGDTAISFFRREDE